MPGLSSLISKVSALPECGIILVLTCALGRWLDLVLALYDNDIVNEASFRAWKERTSDITDAKLKAILRVRILV